jgi:hypothetical protein
MQAYLVATVQNIKKLVRAGHTKMTASSAAVGTALTASLRSACRIRTSFRVRDHVSPEVAF